MSEMKRLMRSRDKRLVAGVCGGLGEYFNVDPTIIRLGFLAGTLFGLPQFTIPAYLILMVLVPQEPAGSSVTIQTAPPTIYQPEPSEPSVPSESSDTETI